MWFVTGEKYLELQHRYEQSVRQLADAQALVVQLEKLLEQSLVQFDSLVTQVVNMRREGFNPSTPPLEFPKRDELPAEIEQALQARAGDDPQLYAKMYRNALLRLQSGDDPAKIAKGIMNGSRINPFAL